MEEETPRDAEDEFSFARRAAEALLDIFIPRICLATGGEPDDPRYRFLSEKDRKSFVEIGENCCDACGAPFEGEKLVREKCAYCNGREFHFGRSRSVVCFTQSARKFVHAVKYDNFRAAIADMARVAAESAPFCAHICGATLVPVPLFPSRKWERGFNQSKVFAEELARRVPDVRCEDLLARTRKTLSQTKLRADERERNVRGAFAVPEKLREKISAKTRYVVIDDVFTTGSTLSDCARALKRAGARNVDAATFAHG